MLNSPHSNCTIIVALAKLIACKGLMPHPLPTNHFKIFTYLEDLDLKKLICSDHLSPASKCIPRCLTLDDTGIVPLLTCKHNDDKFALDL